MSNPNNFDYIYIMKTLKNLHKKTSKINKVGILILVTIILPLLVSISTKVLTTQNIIF